MSKLRVKSRSRSREPEIAVSSGGQIKNESSRYRNDGDGEDTRSRKADVRLNEGSHNEIGLPKEQKEKRGDETTADEDRKSSDSQPGQALLFVWALEQKSSRRGFDTGDSQDQLVPWVLKHDPHAGSTKQRRSKIGKVSTSATTSTEEQYSTGCEAEPHDDGGRDWTSDSATISGSHGQNVDRKTAEKISEKTFHRFYHLYQEGELESECAEAGARVVERGYDRDNWWVVAEPSQEGV